MKYNKQHQLDADIAFLLIVLYYIGSFYNVSKRIISLSDSTSGILLGALLILAGIICYRTIFKLISINAVKIVFGFFIISIIVMHSYAIGIANFDSLCRYTIFLFCACFMFISGLTMNNPEILIDTIHKHSTTLLFILTLIIFKNSEDLYSMGHSILVLPILLISSFKFLKYCKIEDAVRVLWGLGLIVFFGSRGALVSFFIYLILFCISTKKIIYSVVVLAITVICCLYFEDIGSVIISILNDLNVESRSLNLIFTNFLHDSGRGDIYRTFFALIEQKPFIGYGIASDIYLVGYYPHNIFIEILFNFGLIFGTILILLLLVGISASFYDRKARDCVCILFCITAVTLLYSGSYLLNSLFWFYIGICFHTYKKEC